MGRIILFDGECNFCDSSVQFIIQRDPEAKFQFASLQSDAGKELLSQFHVPDEVDSIVLIENNKAYFKSSAALRVCKNLKGTWKSAFLLVVVPKPVRDFVYDFIARNRYKWFGKKESCSLPTAQDRKRFL